MQNGHEAVVERLLAHDKIDVNQTDKFGNTARLSSREWKVRRDSPPWW